MARKVAARRGRDKLDAGDRKTGLDEPRRFSFSRRPAAADSLSIAHETETVAPPFRMKTILLIDDDESCRRAAAAMLRHFGWDVVEAEDGKRGLELALELRPAFILCDLLMPQINGYQVCRMVRD